MEAIPDLQDLQIKDLERLENEFGEKDDGTTDALYGGVKQMVKPTIQKATSTSKQPAVQGEKTTSAHKSQPADKTRVLVKITQEQVPKTAKIIRISSL